MEQRIEPSLVNMSTYVYFLRAKPAGDGYCHPFVADDATLYSLPSSRLPAVNNV